MIRVLIVDDQSMIRAGLRTIIEAQPGFVVVADVADGFRAMELLEADDAGVDVVLMDIRMPGIDGVEATRRIRERQDSSRVKIIVLTTFEHDQNVIAAIRAGADGFLGKGVGPEELAAAITEVFSGGGTLSAAAAAAVIGHVAESTAPVTDEAMAALFQSLTPRELEVVRAVATGLSNEEIAAQSFVSPFTVKTHATRAMAKVGARDRAQLVAYAFRAGIGSPG